MEIKKLREILKNIKYKKLKTIFEIFNQDLNDSLEKIAINFIEVSLNEIKFML